MPTDGRLHLRHVHRRRVLPVHRYLECSDHHGHRFGDDAAADDAVATGPRGTLGRAEIADQPLGRRQSRRIQSVVAKFDVCSDCRCSSRALAGVRHPRISRGRVLRVCAMAARSSAVQRDRSVPLGKYWRSNPLVFSFEPRCHGLRGSAKNTGRPLSTESCSPHRERRETWDGSRLCTASGPEWSKRRRRLLVARWQAKTVCATCPVLTTCREFAMQTNELYGVWGGLTEIDIHNLAGRHRTG